MCVDMSEAQDMRVDMSEAISGAMRCAYLAQDRVDMSEAISGTMRCAYLAQDRVDMSEAISGTCPCDVRIWRRTV